MPASDHLSPDEFDPKQWADEQEPLLLPKEVPWYHGSDADLEGVPALGRGDPRETNYFTHDPDLAASYGRNVYEVSPPEDTRKWDVAHELLEAEYDPDEARENPAHAYDQLTSAFGTKEPLPIKRQVPRDELRERMRYQSPEYGRSVVPSDLWGRQVDRTDVPFMFEGGKYRQFRDDEWDPERAL